MPSTLKGLSAVRRRVKGAIRGVRVKKVKSHPAESYLPSNKSFLTDNLVAYRGTPPLSRCAQPLFAAKAIAPTGLMGYSDYIFKLDVVPMGLDIYRSYGTWVEACNGTWPLLAANIPMCALQLWQIKSAFICKIGVICVLPLPGTGSMIFLPAI